MNDTTENRKQRLAKLANLAEANGWARRPERQATLERLRVGMVTIEDEAPEPKAKEVYDDDDFRRDLERLESCSRRDFGRIVGTWETRCERRGIELPGGLTGVAYVAECRRRYRMFKREYQTSLAYACELLGDLGVGFERLRPLLDRHNVGHDNLAQIQRLYEMLVEEVATARNQEPR
jgi:hypothetical protein